MGYRKTSPEAGVSFKGESLHACIKKRQVCLQRVVSKDFKAQLNFWTALKETSQ